MVSIADNQDVNFVTCTEIVHTFHDVICFFCLAVDGDVPLLADLVSKQVSPLICHGQHSGGLVGTFHRRHCGEPAQHVISRHATGGVHHAGLYGMQQVHLTAASLYHVGGEVKYRLALF